MSKCSKNFLNCNLKPSFLGITRARLKFRKFSALLQNALEDSHRLVPNEILLKYKNVKDVDGFVPDLSGKTKAVFAHYQIKFSTVPGNALYEVNLKITKKT